VAVVFSDLDDYMKLMRDYAYLPHSKRHERVQAYCDLVETKEYFHSRFTKDVEGKIKIQELGKFKKYPRLFISLGSRSIFKSGFLIELLKECFNDEIGDNEEVEFIHGPEYTLLQRTFEKLINPKTIYFPYFSDDSSISIQCNDGVYRANVDISSCDGSHTWVIFKLLQDIADADPRLGQAIRETIDQLKSPLCLRSYSKHKEMKVKLKPVDPVLYTGSTITTVVNNIANLCIFSAVKTNLHGQRPNLSDCRELIRASAESCGYIVTIDECDDITQLQFLKHSPVIKGGVVVPILNLGVILRLFGSCWGDLPYTKDFKSSAYAWNRQLTLSLQHAGKHPLLNMLREKYKHEKFVNKNVLVNIKSSIDKVLSYKINTHTVNSVELSSDDVMKRYSLPGEFLEELISLIRDATDGDGVQIDTICSRVVLAKDYSYVFE